jgi:hypothetical protein
MLLGLIKLNKLLVFHISAAKNILMENEEMSIQSKSVERSEL